jgi:hypothetical protein
VITAQDEEEAAYMFSEMKEQYMKLGLHINFGEN